MQASVITAELPAAHFNAVTAGENAHVVLAMRNAPGFLGAYWFGERSEGLIRVVAFFDAATAAPASSARGKPDARGPRHYLEEALQAVDGRVTGVEEYDVVAMVEPRVSQTAQFCRSIAWQEDPQQIDPAIRRIETGVIPGVRQNPGFQGGFWLVDRPSGRCMGFTLWDTAKHLEASGEVGRQTRREPIQRGEMQVLGLHQYAILARAEAAAGTS